MIKSTYDKFKTNLPYIFDIAKSSENEDVFCKLIEDYSKNIIDDEKASELQKKIASQFIVMLSHENSYIYELSKNEKIYIETFSSLWNYLHLECSRCSNDLFEDLYHLFSITEGIFKDSNYSETKLLKHMKRWSIGIEKEIKERREQRKEYIVDLLIKKIERKASTSRYQFQEGYTYEQKYNKVLEWWNDYRFHLAMAIKSPTELNLFMDESLSTKTMRVLNRAKNKKIPFFITPYYISLLNVEDNGFDDKSVRSYILYSQSLVETYGNIKAWEKEDSVIPGKPNAAGWIIPEANIHRRYPEVAIMIPDTRGRSCGGLCSSCQRLYGFQSEKLHFEMDQLKPKETWDKKLSKLMDYFESDSQLRDILITGGDALMSSNKNLEKILEAVLKMAERKLEANKYKDEKFHIIQRVRLGSRLLAYLPVRIDSELIDILSKFREKGSKIGIKQFVIQTHFQSPLEITIEAKKAIESIIKAGWTISNQLVFTAAASRRGHTAKLRQSLNSLGVVTYYTFTVKGFEENQEVYSTISRSMQEQVEEKQFGLLNKTQKEELISIFEKSPANKLTDNLNTFIKKYTLPFLPTDRNVINIPAIGKSMTFELIGIDKNGKRIHQFDHDQTREHSPIIDKMGKVYIVENRSIVSYLNEIESMGEKASEYSSIWKYTNGSTEQVFELFDYPDPGFTPTKSITNYKDK